MTGGYDLDRFVKAQNGVYTDVVEELGRGKKKSHWMWFVFPQIEGLGFSPTSRRYAIASREEAVAYLAHPTLGRRLLECTRLVLDIDGQTAEQIFGYPDYLKFRSCMTLFSRVTEDNAVFLSALSRYFDGEADPVTMRALE